LYAAKPHRIGSTKKETSPTSHSSRNTLRSSSKTPARDRVFVASATKEDCHEDTKALRYADGFTSCLCAFVASATKEGCHECTNEDVRNSEGLLVWLVSATASAQLQSKKDFLDFDMVDSA